MRPATTAKRVHCPTRRTLLGTVVVLLLLAAPAGAEVSTRTLWPCEPVQVYIDQTAPPPVKKAVEQWHRAFRPDWTFTTNSADAEVLLFVWHPTSTAAGEAVIYGTATTRTRAVIEIDPGHPDPGDVARHELGHVAGLEHSDDPRSAMSPAPVSDRYSVSDLAYMRWLGGRCV